MTHKLILDGLNCANCAAKIEDKIKNTDGYSDVNFVFATKALTLKSDGSHDIVSEIQKIVDSIEDGVTVKKIKENTPENKTHNKGTSEIIKIVASALLLIVALVADNAFNIQYLTAVLCGISVLFSGLDVIVKGIKAVFKLRLDEATLMTVAVIAAFVLGEYFEACLVTFLFAIGELFEERAVASSRKEIEKLASIRPDNATLLTNDGQTIVDARTVKTGDTILVKPYERIPLDGVISKGSSLLDASAITGESQPIDGHVGLEVMSGMKNGESIIEITVTKEFENSTASRILKLVEESCASKGQREKLITRFASVYTPIMLLLSVLIAVVPPLLSLGSFDLWLYRSLVCLVASCPCAIVISVPLSYYAGIGSASKNGVLIKGGRYVEALAKSDSFVFDKTGTLTTGKLTVTDVKGYNGYTATDVLSFAAACEKHSAHPIANAIRSKAKNCKELTLDNYSEKAGYGVTAFYGEKKISCTNARSLTDEMKETADSNHTVFLLIDNKLAGSIEFGDEIRAEAESVLSKLKSLGAKNLVMLTGDKKEKAKETAGKLSLTDFYSELLPDEKVTAVTSLKEKSNSCCFIGDGINDAPVLAAADCGIAMGLGSEAAIEASDAVLSSGDLKQLPKAVKICRKTVATVKSNIAFSLAVKLGVIILAAAGIAPMWTAVLADTGVSVLCVLNSVRILKRF